MLELHEEDVIRIEKLMESTGERIEAEADRARNQIYNMVGGDWTGSAANAALNKQDEFKPIVQRLKDEMDRIKTTLGMGREELTAQDMDAAHEVANVMPDNNFHRI